MAAQAKPKKKRLKKKLVIPAAVIIAAVLFVPYIYVGYCPGPKIPSAITDLTILEDVAGSYSTKNLFSLSNLAAASQALILNQSKNFTQPVDNITQGQQIRFEVVASAPVDTFVKDPESFVVASSKSTMNSAYSFFAPRNGTYSFTVVASNPSSPAVLTRANADSFSYAISKFKEEHHDNNRLGIILWQPTYWNIPQYVWYLLANPIGQLTGNYLGFSTKATGDLLDCYDPTTDFTSSELGHPVSRPFYDYTASNDTKS